VRVIGVPEGGPIVSFTVEGYDPADVAVLVERIAGVQVRSGHHCAARIHQHLGTAAGGTVRASFGPFTTDDDVNALAGAIETITGGA
jgi:selenocysteine lyase/cysteine desulfurase